MRPFVDGLLTDIRGAWRLLRRRHLVSILVLCTFALGIGANTAIIAVARGVLLRPLPYANPEELVMIWRTPKERPSVLQGFADEARLGRQIATPEMVREWREGNSSLSDLAAMELWQGNLSAQMDLVGPDDTQRLRGAFTSPNFFSVLGVQATIGRTFLPDDQDVVILSNALWRRQFGADPGIVGRTITIASGRDRQRSSLTVVGVLSERFRFTYPEDTELWKVLPWEEIELAPPSALRYQVMGRLRPGITLAQADADIAALYEGRERQRHIPPDRQMTTRLELLHEHAVGRMRPALNMLFGVTAIVLLVACVSVANLLIAQSAGRRREIAIQRALGASRFRIARQLLTEGFVTAACAGALAILTVAALQPSLRSLLPASAPRADEVGLDWVTIGWAMGLGVLVVIASGLVPSWRAAAVHPHSQLTGTSTTMYGPARFRLQQSLIVAQVASVLVLLVAGGLLLRSFWNLGRVDLGFDGSAVVTAEIRLLNPSYRDPPRLRAFQHELLSRVRALPSVTAASLTSAVPFRGVDFIRTLTVADGSGTLMSNERRVEPQYFDIMRIPLLAGRLFSEADGASAAPVAVVSESFARAMFSGGMALGQSLSLQRPTEIIGIVRDVRTRRVEDAGTPAIYLSQAQAPTELVCLVVRTGGEPAALTALIPAVVRSIDPEQPLRGVTTIDRLVSESIADRRFYAVATAAFAIVTMLIAAAGTCGVLVCSVTERTRELGIRAAMGAQPRDQVAEVLWRGMAPISIGVALGTFIAFTATRTIRQFLFDVVGLDPGVYFAAAVIVGSVGLLACYVPARSAARMDPMTALRQE